MNFNAKMVVAILLKELQDIKKNLNILAMYFLPVLLTLVWSFLIPDLPEGFALGFGLLFLVVMVGMYVPSMLIAEEKEKKTLEVLLLSPASSADVLMGKGLLTFISIIITTLILLLITGIQAVNIIPLFIGTILISIFAIFIGMMVGLLAPNQMATGTIGLPVYLLLLLVPQLAAMPDNAGILQMIARFLPTNYYFQMLEMILNEGLVLREMLLETGVITLSIILSFILLVTIYKKKGLGN